MINNFILKQIQIKINLNGYKLYNKVLIIIKMIKKWSLKIVNLIGILM